MAALVGCTSGIDAFWSMRPHRQELGGRTTVNIVRGTRKYVLNDILDCTRFSIFILDAVYLGLPSLAKTTLFPSNAPRYSDDNRKAVVTLK
jgi:hypothetical protein